MRERHNATSREALTMKKRKRQESTNAKAKDSKRWKNLSGIVDLQKPMRKAERRGYGEMCSEAVEMGLDGKRKFDGPEAVHALTRNIVRTVVSLIRPTTMIRGSVLLQSHYDFYQGRDEDTGLVYIAMSVLRGSDD
jgi:hypothetical protein